MKAESGPEEQGNAQVFQRIVLGPRQQTAVEDDAAENPDGEDHDRTFRKSAKLKSRPGRSEPQEQQRRNQQIADKISQPPGEPHGKAASTGEQMRRSERGDSDAGAQRGGWERCETDEAENAGGFVEGVCPAGKSPHQHRPDKRLKRVPNGDGQGRQRRLRNSLHRGRAERCEAPSLRLMARPHRVFAATA